MRLRIPCENPGVSGGSVGQHFGLRPNNREGTQPPPSTENWKIGLKITEDGPTNQIKAQFPPQSLSPIRKLS